MSAYMESVVGSGEQVQYQAKVSLWSMLPLFLLGLVLLPFYGLGLIAWVVAYIKYSSTELAITDKKIIAKFGFIKRDTIELLIPKAESVQVNQSILGRIFDAGNPQAPVPGIDSPMEFRKCFMDVQERTASPA